MLPSHNGGGLEVLSQLLCATPLYGLDVGVAFYFSVDGLLMLHPVYFLHFAIDYSGQTDV